VDCDKIAEIMEAMDYSVSPRSEHSSVSSWSENNSEPTSSPSTPKCTAAAKAEPTLGAIDSSAFDRIVSQDNVGKTCLYKFLYST
jgi:hypothetical protein